MELLKSASTFLDVSGDFKVTGSFVASKYNEISNLSHQGQVV